MLFVKMHGLGNDFIVTESSSWAEADKLQPCAQKLCDRNFGIGADGLVVIGKDNEQDIFMRIFNSDGTEPEMCGNGIRCVARYAYEQGLVDKTHLSVKTRAGIINPRIILHDGVVETIQVDMGQPVLDPARIPVVTPDGNVGIVLKTADRDFVITAVSMGNPHCIVFVDDLNVVPLAEWGPKLEKHEMFPARTNVEFVQVLNNEEIIMKVWERGAGATLACGTGACATLVAAVLNGKAGRRALIHLAGGNLNIEWDETNNHVYMTGPAVRVFEGEI